MPRQCSNPGCENVESDKPFLRCSQCKAAYYCSKYVNLVIYIINRECQSKHWKSGHKLECKKAISPVSKPQLKFTCFSKPSDEVECGEITIEKIINANADDIWEAFTSSKIITV